MKNLIRFALGAAVAGVLVHRLLKRSSESASNAIADELIADEPIADEPIADTNMVHSGDPGAEQDAPQPQDWRGAQNVLE